MQFVINGLFEKFEIRISKFESIFNASKSKEKKGNFKIKKLVLSVLNIKNIPV